MPANVNAAVAQLDPRTLSLLRKQLKSDSLTVAAVSVPQPELNALAGALQLADAPRDKKRQHDSERGPL